jgi:protein-tyrosine phosphatase
MILGVPKGAIERDYSLTDAALVSDRHDRVLEIRELGLTDDWADTHPDMISAVQDHVHSKYGGLDAYLDHIGFGETDRSNVRKALLY